MCIYLYIFIIDIYIYYDMYSLYCIYIWSHPPYILCIYYRNGNDRILDVSKLSMCASEPHDAMALLDTCHACGEPRSCVTGDSLGVFQHQISGI